MSRGAPSHAGFVVTDIAAAMEELSAMLGTSWTGVLERTVGPWPLRIAFSLEGPPFFELIEGPPGSPWACPDGTRMHHLGWWVDDLDGERERLAAEGLDGELGAAGAPGLSCEYYPLSASGLRVELVSRSVQDALRATWGIAI